MAKKRKPSAPKNPPPPSFTEVEEAEEEEEENAKDTSTPVRSRPSSKIPISNKSTSEANHTQNAHSSEEEGDEDEDEDSESEKAKYIAAQTKPTRPKKQKEVEEDESDNNDAEAGSDSDSESPTIKPNSSKPKGRQPKPKKPITKARSATPSKKQQAANISSDNRSKEARSKNKHARRVMGDDDVIRLLNGMIEFAEMGLVDAHSDLNSFHKFINKSLQRKVTRYDMHERIRYEKRKFKAQLQREREGRLVFARPFGEVVYKIAKKIWGAEYSATEDDEDDMDVENDFLGDASNTENASKSLRKSLGFEKQLVLYPHLNGLVHSAGIVSASGLGERDVKRAFELMSPSHLKEWDKRCMKIRSKERDIYMERLTLAYELTKQCYDLVKSSSV